jgi:uncharacterized protein
MDIPYQAINAQTLCNMIEEFVTRDGTDYGEQELTLEAKVEQVLASLKTGKVVVQYDESLDICEIVMVN